MFAAAIIWTVYWVGVGHAELTTPGADLAFHSQEACEAWLEYAVREGIIILGPGMGAECREVK
jgi:hypothetical protein